MSQGCCNNVTITQRQVVVELDDLFFTVRIQFCSNCGSKKSGGTGIRDGKKVRNKD